ERLGRLLLIGPDLPQNGDDLADDERQRDEDRREDHPREREENLDPVSGETAEPTTRSVEQIQRQPDHDGRKSERQVDDRVDQAAAREAVPDERDREDDAEKRVQGNRDRCNQQRQPESVERLGARDGIPGRPEPVLERPVENEPDRQKQQEGEVAERPEAKRVPTDHGASSSAGKRRSGA